MGRALRWAAAGEAASAAASPSCSLRAEVAGFSPASSFLVGLAGVETCEQSCTSHSSRPLLSREGCMTLSQMQVALRIYQSLYDQGNVFGLAMTK